MKTILKFAAIAGAAGVMMLSAIGPTSARTHYRAYLHDGYGSYGYAGHGYGGYGYGGNSATSKEGDEGN